MAQELDGVEGLEINVDDHDHDDDHDTAAERADDTTEPAADEPAANEQEAN